MLELKRIHILGFKSFCDRTELSLDSHGVTAIVGPNGCGKSNISDAISWVLGEQSAKSLRGVKMEDVIFAGTRDRKPTGMAQVTLVLTDPEVYQGPAESSGPEIVESDWDEAALRLEAARETEAAIADLQPGVPVEEAESEASQDTDPNAVVLKVRRRKFQRYSAEDGQVVITRRLFRTGESEYLLNGKLCRLRDIHDVLMGTGLGAESYGIIEQERIGQLLSSKPHDRRAIVEEAAGITRFKTKKHLAELRLEQARQNLARVNDIFDEVVRQMNSLKRQAAKAERYGTLRDELHQRLRVVIATRLSLMDQASTMAAEDLARLTARIGELSQEIAGVDRERASAVSDGYQCEQQAREAAIRANSALVELERVLAQIEANRDRMADLERRIEAARTELLQAEQQLVTADAERSQQKAFLTEAEETVAAAKRTVEARRQAGQKASGDLTAAEQRIEAARKEVVESLRQSGRLRSEMTQAEASIEALDRDAQRLEARRVQVQSQLEKLGMERGQVSLAFESASTSLESLEAELKQLHVEIDRTQAEEAESRRHSDRFRAELATLQGRSNSLEALIREHGYSTDTVRKLLRAHATEAGHAPVGVLADFVEVSGEYETVVDEFLRDELNYIVVKSWNDAQEGMRVLKTDVDGRATFLVHPEDSQAKFSFAPGVMEPLSEPRAGVLRLKDCIRVLDGFGSSLEVILPKLRHGYVVPDSETARSLALENPDAFFLAPDGECFHNVTVTGGKPSAEGPLALKRELREVRGSLARTEEALAKVEVTIAGLTRTTEELSKQIETKSVERRKAEQESAHSGAALRQMESDANRLERDRAECALQIERNRREQSEKSEWLRQRREAIEQYDRERAESERQVEESQGLLNGLRTERDAALRSLSDATATLAGLEERRRGAASSSERVERAFQDLNHRVQQLTEQIASGVREKEQRAHDQESLESRRAELEQNRDAARAENEERVKQTEVWRQKTSEIEQRLQTLRAEMESLQDKRGEGSAAAARVASDLAHLEQTCLQELSLEAGDLRADLSVPRLEAEPLLVEEEACRSIRQKIDSLGPVNMMALDEYKEAAERHGFLETQRQDLIDSIDNTMTSIREIEGVLRSKFEEAFTAINENFSATFAQLFGGGQAFMRLTDEENSDESGIDIIASPPGKKLQNVLLLSGGEKALTALSLLMAIFQYQPSPFCVLDEVDAALDESNIGRLANMLQGMAGRTHFIVITHSKRMMQTADAIFGVTMQEPGISKVVSVRLTETRSREKVSA